MATKTLPIEHIYVHEGSTTPRVGGVTVAFLSRLMDDPNRPVERICEQYGLTPAEVYAGWLYYSEHREEIDRSILEAEEKARQNGTPVIIPD